MQALGDRAGEASAWHQLATIDLNEGSYAAARDKFGKAPARIIHGPRSGTAKRVVSRQVTRRHLVLPSP
jgi:hypothetical protein